MNLLFVNYGDFTTNSLNHIAGFARALGDLGHACVVAVPRGPETLEVVSEPRFIPATYGELIARPGLFPDGRPADLIHAWTPRESVRQFVLAYQRLARARLIVHLEDNEEFLLAAWFGRPLEELRDVSEAELADQNVTALSHPRRYRHLLRAAEGVTVIVDTLRQFVPAGVPCALLRPGVDFERYHPEAPDSALRRELGLRDEEKVLVFTGSNTFANEPEMRELYDAVALLNERGIPTRLVRTGFNSPTFQAALPAAVKAQVLDLGFVAKDRLPSLLRLADALVQPGRAGPFNDFRLPSKLPEFLSVGRPVILPAANLGRELRDGEDALVLRTGAPAEIADACARVFTDPALAGRLGRNAAAFARRHFDLAANTAGLARFYAEIAAAPLRPGSTSSLAEGETELSLSVRALGAGTDAPLAADLAALVTALERQEPAQGALRRLERERDEWRRQCRLADQHAKNLDRRLAQAREDIRLADQHSRNLSRQLAQVRGQLQRLNDRLAQSEKSLELTRVQLSEYQRRCEVLAAREAKIRAMQASFSWRVTQPLRWLRRKFIDSHRASDEETAAAQPVSSEERQAPLAFSHSVDHPADWNLPPGPLLLRGWCFADDGRKLTAIRAVLPDRTVAGAYGLKRSDVVAAAPGKPQAEFSGWTLELELTPVDAKLDLEAADETGAWHPFAHADLVIDQAFRSADPLDYEKWLEAYEALTPEVLGAQAHRGAALALQPVISVLLPTYNTPERWLRCAVDSVRAQTYPHWELCAADDASTEPHIRLFLEQAAREDPRIKVVFRPQNGHISAASNSALELATGEFTALLDHDDELAPHALYEMAVALNARPDADYLYSDEDKIDELGRRREPNFKPDWLPDLFLGQNYASHLSVYRTALLRAVGGFRAGFEGSQDWDLTLRVVEKTSPGKIVHLPRILYHWRSIPGSTAFILGEKDYAGEAARRALGDHFARRREEVEILPVRGGHWRIKYPLPPAPPLVSLIIPTRNRLPYLRRCVDSLLEKTSYPKFEILVVDNGSDDPATLDYLRGLTDGTHPLVRPEHGVRVLRDDAPFNYSALNNRAAREARGALIGLLNNDLETINSDWLEEMAAQALRPEIGCVGAMLYYPDETIQHAGCVLGIGGVAGHAFKTLPRGDEGAFNRARLAQNYSAVTAACLVVRKAVYEQVGGLDEEALAVAFNDVDFCLKVRAAGYRNLWTPFAEFYHHESASRGSEDTPEKHARFRREIEVMTERWDGLLTQDPAYNPNLTLEHEDFSLASPPRPGGLPGGDQVVNFLEFRRPGYALLSGAGIEIGGFEHPAELPHASRVIRCDRLSKADAAKLFPEIDPAALPNIDVVLDLDTEGLAPFADGTQDFVVCCHVLEHLKNPIKALGEIFRVLRNGGRAALAIPDKRFTFDRTRPLTPWQKLREIHAQGIARPSPEDYLDIIRLIHPALLDAPEVERRFHLERLLSRREHLNIWDSASFAEFLADAMPTLGRSWRIRYESTGEQSRFEHFVVLEKSGPDRDGAHR